MTRQVRKILFFVFSAIFLIVGPSLILYFQGYRFDFENKRLTQTGGLFLKTIPKQVEIYLDGKLTKKTDFFFGSALIDNLLPRKYNVEIKKEGYSPWQKELEIKEKGVTEAKNIVLFPKNPNFNVLAGGVEGLWFSPDGKKIIFKEKEENYWTLKLYDLEKNVKSHLLRESDISTKGVSLFSIEFSQNSKEITLEVGLKEQIKYFSLGIDKIPPTLKEVKKTITPPENSLIYQEFDGEIYYLDNLGNLLKTDSSFALPAEKISGTPFPVQQETEYQLYVFPESIFLREGETLSFFNQNSKSFEKFFEKIKNIKVSPDNEKMVYFSDSEIWILFSKEKLSQPTKKAGEKLFLIRLSDSIQDVFWLNSDYLVFNTANTIKIIEIDDRDRTNIVDLIPPADTGGGLKIFWNQTDKKLYILSEDNLYQSSSLLP